MSAKEESCGLIDAVSDKQIIDAYKYLALAEGVFAEPASCASVAGLFMLKKSGYFNKISHKREIIITCTLTGHGLKDPQLAIKSINMPPVVAAKLDAVIKAAGI